MATVRYPVPASTFPSPSPDLLDISAPPSRRQRVEVGKFRVSDPWVVDTSEDLQRLVNFLSDTKEAVTIDTETKGHDVRAEHARYKARATSVQFSTDEIPRIYLDNYADREGSIQAIRKWAEDPTKLKDGHNIKYEFHVLANHGIRLRGIRRDSLVLDALRDTSREGRHDLETACFDWGLTPEPLEGYSETFSWHPPLKGKKGDAGGVRKLAQLKPHWLWWEEGARDKVIQYGVKDPYWTRKLGDFHESYLRNLQWTSRRSFWDYYELIELPFTEVLAEMELEGAVVDMEHLARLQEQFQADATGYDRQFFRILSENGVDPTFLEKFSLASADQLADLLYNRLGFECPKMTKGGKDGLNKKPSVDEEALEKLQENYAGDPLLKILDPFLKGREVKKLNSTYALALYEWASQYRGRVHTGLNQIGTATWRLSSSKPNLQNIPVRSPLGKEIRKAFIAPPGNEVLVADYSQIELRITAHKSGDPTLLRYFKEGKDPHARTAYKLFQHIQRDVDAKFGGIDSKEAQKYVKTTYEEERGRGKTFNFMALYGGGTKRAMGVFGVGKEEAEEKIAQFWDAYPTVRRMLDRSTQKARKLGYVENLFGMRFHLPDINHHDIWIRRSVERQAGNYEIQGSAGGIIKMAMILIHRDERLKAVGYKQILQIHDELVGYSPLGAREVVEPIVKDLMENSYLHFGFKPLGSQEFGRLETTVEPGFGAHWAEAKH